jgi:amino acid transporter
LLIALGMILAVPDMAAAVKGEVNPAEAALTNAFGPLGARAMFVCLLLIVLSATVSVIASCSRLLFALGRDNLIFGSHLMARIDEARGLPVPAVAAATLVPVAIVALGTFAPSAAAPIISFATAGIYTAFAMVVLAAVMARAGGWSPAGAFRLGSLGWPVTIAALTFEVGAILNIIWPRPASPDAGFYATYLIPIALAAIIVLGLLQLGRASRVQG